YTPADATVRRGERAGRLATVPYQRRSEVVTDSPERGDRDRRSALSLPDAPVSGTSGSARVEGGLAGTPEGRVRVRADEVHRQTCQRCGVGLRLARQPRRSRTRGRRDRVLGALLAARGVRSRRA